MAAKPPASPAHHNWWKQWQAVFITRKALLPTVKLEADNLHKDLEQRAAKAQSCPNDHGYAKDNSRIPCQYHTVFRDEVKSVHKRQKPSWRNSKTGSWKTSPFSVAKLFMQDAGYDDKNSFDETDFNGVAAFIYNCGRFTSTVERLSDEVDFSCNFYNSMCAVRV